VTVLGAVTHEGESFYCWTEENLTADHGVRLLGALETRFGEDLIVRLDQATYIYANDLWKSVSGEERTQCMGETSIERVRNDTLQGWYFPPRDPELNPVGGCWNQLDDWFNYRLIDDLAELQDDLLTAFPEIVEPNLFNYLLPEDAREEFT
jgi:hypothetical protein